MPTPRDTRSSAGYKYLLIFGARNIWHFHKWVPPASFPRVSHHRKRAWAGVPGQGYVRSRAQAWLRRVCSQPVLSGREEGRRVKRWTRGRPGRGCPHLHGSDWWGIRAGHKESSAEEEPLFTSAPEYLCTFIPWGVSSGSMALTWLSEVKDLPPDLLPPQMLPEILDYKEDVVALSFSLKFFYSAVKTKQVCFYVRFSSS